MRVLVNLTKALLKCSLNLISIQQRLVRLSNGYPPPRIIIPAARQESPCGTINFRFLGGPPIVAPPTPKKMALISASLVPGTVILSARFLKKSKDLRGPAAMRISLVCTDLCLPNLTSSKLLVISSNDPIPRPIHRRFLERRVKDPTKAASLFPKAHLRLDLLVKCNNRLPPPPLTRVSLKTAIKPLLNNPIGTNLTELQMSLGQQGLVTQLIILCFK